MHLKRDEWSMKQGFLDRHSKIHYIGKCIRHFNDETFIDRVLLADENPYEIEFVELGDNNPDKLIQVIPNIYYLDGFCAEFRNTLKLLAYADRYGFIPYVLYDKNYIYKEDTLIFGTDNPFEYYFNQTCDLTYDSVMHSANVVFAEKKHTKLVDLKCGIMPYSYEMNQDNINWLGEIYKKYIQINSFSMKKITMDYENLLGGSIKVLGVHHRGTDYKKAYKYHPKYVTVEEKIAEVESIEEDYDRIFLATDDREAGELFRKRFRSKVCFYEDVYRGEGSVSVAFSLDGRENHKYLLGLEVLRDVYTLSLCEGLIAGISQVAYCAQIMKKGMGGEFSYFKIIDKGINASGPIFRA